ncbi:MAG: hypothetical protein ABIR78_14280 [Ferruginibacter sp.]
MKFFYFVLMISCLSFISCNTSDTKNNTDVLPHANEADAIKKAVDDAYRAICFKHRQQFTFTDIKKSFIPQAQLVNFGDDTLQVLTIDQFVDFYKKFIDSNKVSSFYEEEINGTTDQFGRIAQRISSYNTYINTMDSVAQRGVNSFQLVKTLQGWKVSSIIWDIESQKLKIPGYYLKVDSTR